MGRINEMLKYGGNRMVKCCVLLLIWLWGPGTGQMIGGGIILCHSLKLGMMKWLVIIGDSYGELCSKSDESVAGKLSKFSENHILAEG